MTPMPRLKTTKQKVPNNPTPAIDLTQANDLRPRAGHPWRNVLFVLAGAVLIIAGVVALKFYRTGNTVLGGTNTSLFSQISTLITNPDKQLRGESEGRINVALLGLGGAGHDGAYLTDTIIIASFKPQTKEVAMLSLPRDLYVEIPSYGYRKINNAFAFGREKNTEGGGEELSVATIQNVIDVPIHYYTWVDFSGFKKLIDDLGGITVTVDQSFVDYQYPAANYAYQTVTFSEGTEKMSGERALMYVRSRHGTNGEGSDFARSRRQQNVLMAVKQKLSGFGTLANPARVSSVLDNLSSHMRTNMQVWELMRLAKLFDGVTKDDIATRVLDTSPSGLLKSGSTADGAYILQPKTGNYENIQYLAQHIFDFSAIAKEDAKVVVINATKDKAFGTEFLEELATMNYRVTQQASLATARSTSTIYDLSLGTKPETLKDLTIRISTDVQTTLPAEVKATLSKSESPDFVIVVGTDALPKDLKGGPVAFKGDS